MAMIPDSENKVLCLGALALAFCWWCEQRPTFVGGRGLQPSSLPNHKSNFHAACKLGDFLGTPHVQSALTQNGSACKPNHWGLPRQLPTRLPCSILAPALPCKARRDFPQV